MPSIWVIAGAAVAAINLRLIVPVLLAFLGIWNPRQRAPRITA